MKKILFNILVIVYIVVAIAVTVCLLSFNKYRISEFGDYSLIIINDNELNPEYNKGDLVIVCDTDKVEVGEKGFFYNTYDNEMPVVLAEVKGKEKVTMTENTYTIDGEYKISQDYYLGAQSTNIVIPKLGGILNILESKWGFLFLVVLPTLVAFLYEVATVVAEVITINKGNNEKVEE